MTTPHPYSTFTSISTHSATVSADVDFVTACSLWQPSHLWQHCEDILDEGGIELLLDVIKLWTTDEIMVRAAVRALTPLAKDTGDEAEHILELGGRAIMDEIQQLHRQDNDVLRECKQVWASKNSGAPTRTTIDSRQCLSPPITAQHCPALPSIAHHCPSPPINTRGAHRHHRCSF